MEHYKTIIDKFVQQNRQILGDNLIGVYLHGSAVMNCFNDKKSDLDFIIVVKNDISCETKRQYMNMVVSLNRQAPAKGIELSIIRQSVCNPFVYPTPFLLHFSIAHLDWYTSDPETYLEKMKGTDKDLAAHFTVLYHRGQTLYGKDIRAVFSEVSSADYFDSIWQDVRNAQKEIIKNPAYIILNLCRVLAYHQNQVILSKAEGGKWGLAHVPDKYKILIEQALKDYETAYCMKPDQALAREYAEFMLKQLS